MQSPEETVCVLVTAPSIAVARKIAAAALKERLVACANLIPKVESHYWWQGQLESSSEVLILLKTGKEKIADLERCVLKHHPYQTPEFIGLTLSAANEKYLTWIHESIQPRG